MNKFILIFSLLIFNTAFAEPEHHEHHEHHGWSWSSFFGGAVVGAIIAKQIDGHYYAENGREVRKVVDCKDYIVYDEWDHPFYDRFGHFLTERRCTEYWVYID